MIEECYGRNTDYYHTTAANLEVAKQALHKHMPSSHKTRESQEYQESLESQHSSKSIESQQSSEPHYMTESGASSIPAISHHISGLALSRAFWNDLGKPLLAGAYSAYQGRIAAGLVGYGSECFGFDDELSRDHDFAPRFCLWLTDEDYDAIGEQLQADYDALSRDFTVAEQGNAAFAGHGSANSRRSLARSSIATYAACARRVPP